MANIKKIQVNGVEYEVYDEAAHRLINRVRNEMPADLTENAQGRIILIDENGNPIGDCGIDLMLLSHVIMTVNICLT